MLLLVCFYISKMCISSVQQTIEAWKTVFIITAGVYAFGTVFYGLFGSGEIQPWAKPEDVLYVVEPTASETEDTKSDSLLTKQNVCCNDDLCTKL